ncbi:MAG TPA: hypothetical protein VJN89_02760 [Candidatus Acidoferrum sp.]|nr:hypothetical protein [Candidatus Acidoferrum sp.]
MPAPRDFRKFNFSQARVERCGKYVGRYNYWKLYAIENILRVTLNSVLSRQIGPAWWTVAVDPDVQKKATKVRASYASKPWHTPAGSHDIYYVFLPDISNIMRANSHLLAPVIPAISTWIKRIDDIRIPRNLVGHMNFPNLPDRQMIDALHRDMGSLIGQVQSHGLPVNIP